MTQHKPALQEDAGPFALDDAEDMLINVGEVAPLLNCDTVAAVCTRVDATPRELRRWSSEDIKRYSIYFWFVVTDPVEYQDVELMMYCRWNRHWREKGFGLQI